MVASRKDRGPSILRQTFRQRSENCSVEGNEAYPRSRLSRSDDTRIESGDRAYEMIGVGVEWSPRRPPGGVSGLRSAKRKRRRAQRKPLQRMGQPALAARVAEGVVRVVLKRDKVRQSGLPRAEREARRAAGVLGRARGARPREGCWLVGAIESARR